MLRGWRYYCWHFNRVSNWGSNASTAITTDWDEAEEVRQVHAGHRYRDCAFFKHLVQSCEWMTLAARQVDVGISLVPSIDGVLSIGLFFPSVSSSLRTFTAHHSMPSSSTLPLIEPREAVKDSWSGCVTYYSNEFIIIPSFIKVIISVNSQ